MTPALQNSVTIQLAFEPRICAFWNTVRGENERYQCISARFAYFVVPVSVGTFQLQLRGRCRRIKFQKLIGHSSSSLSTSELRPVIFNLNGERLQARYHASSAQVRSVRGGVLKLVRGFCYQGKRVYYSLASNGVASISQCKTATPGPPLRCFSELQQIESHFDRAGIYGSAPLVHPLPVLGS